MDTEIEEVKSKIKNLEQQIDDVVTEIEEVKSKIKNLEQQIDDVVTEIEEVKSKIKNLEQQIDDVVRQIEDVVRQLTTAGPVDILYLRNKEEELRNKEEELRNKELELRNKKLSLLERLLLQERVLLQESVLLKAKASATMPWHEWVVQEMPPIPYAFGSRSSFQVVKDSVVPDEVKAWDNWPEVAQYVADVASKPAQLERINMKFYIDLSPPIISSEASASFLYQTFLINVGRNIIDGFSLDLEVNIKSLDNTWVVALARGSSGERAGVALSCGNRTFIVVEVKRPSYFRRGVDQQPFDLVDAYSSDTRKCDKPLTFQKPIEQVLRYFVGQEIGYGIISSLDVSYLVRRVEDSLHISKGIEWTNPRFVAAHAFFLKMAAEDTITHEWKGGANPPQDLDIGGTYETDKGLDTPKSWKRTKTTKIDKGLTWSMTGAGSGLKETLEADLHLEKQPFATGWSGNIVRGRYEDQDVAVKLAPVPSKRADALLNESIAYFALQEHWGKYVPALVSHGTTGKGNVMYIASEFIKGSELGMECVTQEVATACLEALRAIHGCGVLHGDIRPQNILVLQGGQQGVRFVDFGFARPFRSLQDGCNELAQLQYLVSMLFSNSDPAVSIASIVDRGENLEAETNYPLHTERALVDMIQ